MGWLKKVVKKVGKVVKKVAPYALGAASFFPGVGGAIAKGAQKIYGKITGKPTIYTVPEDGSSGKQVGGIGGFLNQLGGAFSSAKKFAEPWLPLAGDIYSGKQMQDNSREQMAFQERMANTAHQREAADLQAAGLNRILSGTGGGGSATPSGSTAGTPDYGSSVSSGLSLKLLQAQIANTMAQTETQRATTGNVQASTQRTQMETDQLGASGPYFGKNARYQSELLRGQVADLANRTRLSAAEAEKAVQLLRTMLKTPDLQHYMLSAPSAERTMFNRVLSGQADASAISKALKILKEMLK